VLRISLLRVAWVTLPLTAGPAASAALQGWADAPRVAAEVLLWLAWAGGLLATLAPRPATLTALRVIAPCFVLAAVLAAVDGAPSTVATVGALAATLLCAVLASGHDIAIAAANAMAYGDEQRFPLRVPPALYAGLLPGARLLVAAGVVAPVLLLADEQWIAGLAALMIGAPIAFFLSRSLHTLSRRWAVLVPAGFVVVDPFTLADPVLFLRERLRTVTPFGTDPAPDGFLDLRLGASAGSIAVGFDEPAELFTASRARRGGETVEATGLVVAAVRRDELLAAATARRLPVRAGT